jgi:hypothetical protein
VRKGDVLRYALLVYNTPEVDQRSEEQQRQITAEISKVLARPNVTSWMRLRNVESATTARYHQGTTLLTDGPFVDSKDYLGGLIVVEAENLDGALAIVDELQGLRGAGAIEIRPLREEHLRGA